MFSSVGRMLTRNITRTSVHVCTSYRLTGRLVHHQVTGGTKKLQVPSGDFNSFEVKSTYIPIMMKPLPVAEPGVSKITQILELPFPFSRVPLPIDVMDPLSSAEVTEPTQHKVQEKQAARLIVIRRRKMKKHKLRKLRKKMKFLWAKVRFRRETRKEKLFQAKLVSQINEGEKFDAAQYIAEKLKKVQEFTEGKESKPNVQKIIQQNPRYGKQR